MPKDPSNLPARQVPLDRTTIERVLARAAELQATSGSDEDGESNLSESQLIEIGKEVGINPTTLTQALASGKPVAYMIGTPAHWGSPATPR